MKKIILLASILITLLSLGTHAQTISSQGRTIKLTPNQVAILMSYNVPAINTALAGGYNVKNNSTADAIFSLLKSK